MPFMAVICKSAKRQIFLEGDRLNVLRTLADKDGRP
jgi:hypothetical protein